MTLAIILILILILLIIFSTIFVYLYFKRKIENFSFKILGTKNIIKGLKDQEILYSETPKSVSSMNSIIIPKIKNDFPNIDINELKEIVENAIILYFKSLENKKLIENKKYSNKIKTSITKLIEESKNMNITYSNIKIHNTVINSYTNNDGTCKITFQSSLEYIKCINDEKNKIQDRLNTELIYIYDDTKLKDKYGVSLNCKNCGAPIKKLGVKNCPYCETGIIEFTSKIWKINDIYKK